MVTVNADKTLTVRVRLINLGAVQARFIVDGLMRYDCTKPIGDQNWMKRVSYNLRAPNQQYDSCFYKLKMRIEIKTRRWLFFGWKCKRCEDLINESGSCGESQPSCAEDMERYMEQFNRPTNEPCPISHDNELMKPD